MDADALHNLGQRHYQSANYTEALEAFSKALQLPQADTVGILDNRAATYTKLGNLNAALRDGRRMIKALKTDARGYLRTAKILLLTEKHDHALQTYQHALRVLPHENAGRRQIEQLAAKLDRKLHGPKLVDPFKSLPREIVLMILEYFDFATLTKLQRVSKSWQTLLPSFPTLWTHLDLSTARRSVSYRAIRAFLRKHSSEVSRVTLTNVTPVHVPQVLSTLARCPNISHLDTRVTAEAYDLHKFTKLTTLITTADIKMSLDLFIHILNTCPLLVHVDVCVADAAQVEYNAFPSRLDNLRYLAITSQRVRQRPLSSVALPLFLDGTIADRIPNLEELYLQDQLPDHPGHDYRPDLAVDVSKLSRLRRLGLLRMRLGAFNLPESLEHLSLSHSIASFWEPEATPKFPPNLKSATLNEINTFSDFFLRFMFSEPRPSLKRLDLERCLQLDLPLNVKNLMETGHFESITELNIARTPFVTDSLTPIIIATMPNLKILDVSMTNITGLSIAQLVNTEKLKIEKICARKLGAPLSRDVVEYAQQRGVQIVRSLNRTIEEKLAQPRR